MPVSTPNNFFAEDTLGPITAKTTPETTVVGLAKLFKNQQILADNFENSPKPLVDRVKGWAKKGGLAILLASTVVASANAVRTLSDRVDGSVIPTAEEVEQHPEDYVPHVMQPDETVSGVVSPFVDDEHRVTSAVDHAANQQPDGSVETGDTIYLPKDTEQK